MCVSVSRRKPAAGGTHFGGPVASVVGGEEDKGSCDVLAHASVTIDTRRAQPYRRHFSIFSSGCKQPNLSTIFVSRRKDTHFRREKSRPSGARCADLTFEGRRLAGGISVAAKAKNKCSPGNFYRSLRIFWDYDRNFRDYTCKRAGRPSVRDACPRMTGTPGSELFQDAQLLAHLDEGGDALVELLAGYDRRTAGRGCAPALSVRQGSRSQ